MATRTEDTAGLTDLEAVAVAIQDDPTYFATDVLGVDPWDKQIEILESIRDNRETYVASCHGAGKSFISADAALWFALAHYPSITITTAPTDRQVKGILWKEIRLAHQRARRNGIPLGGTLLQQELKWSDDHWIWGFTAADWNPDRFQGFHEESILVIVDEACGVTQAIYDGIAGVLSSENAKLLLIGNPTDPTGYFGRTFKPGKPGHISISAFDTPNFKAFGITEQDVSRGIWKEKVTGPLPYPALVTPQWVEDVYHRWGPDNPLYVAKVLGKFPQESSDALIPLRHIQDARDRHITVDRSVQSQLGVDIARFGEDQSVIAHRKGPRVRIEWVGHKLDTMRTTGEIIRVMRETEAVVAKVDVVGIGSGVVDRLKEQGYTTAEVNAGAAPRDKERFANTRAEWYWALRERFESEDIDLEDEDELASQLAQIKYGIDSKGRIKIEKKEDAKKRGIPSPDKADAVMHAFADVRWQSGAPSQQAWEQPSAPSRWRE